MKRARLLVPCVAILLSLVGFAASANAKPKIVIKETIEVSTKLSVPALGTEMTCAKGKGLGSLTGPKDGEETVTLSKCSTRGKKCNSVGAKAGTVKTEPILTTLGYINKAENRAGVSFKAASGETTIKIECEGLKAETLGSVIGEETGNVGAASKTSTLHLTAEGAHQIPESFEGGPKETVGFKLEGGLFEATVTTTAKNKYNAPIEIGPGPAYLACVKVRGGKFADANCSIPSEGKSGKFELEEV